MQFRVTNYSAYDSAVRKQTASTRMERTVSSYEFELYTEDCSGGVTINGVPYQARRGSFSLTKPGWRQKMRPPYKCYFFNVHTEDAVLCELLDALPVYGVLWDLDEVVKVFHELLQVENGDVPENQLLIDSCVCKLLNLILRTSHSEDQQEADSALSHRRMLQRVDRYIRNHYMEELSLKDLADQCGLHPNYFHRLYTAAFGETPAQRILSCRIGAAKIMLLTQSCTMSDIAAQCGFSSQTYFGYKFKEVMGQTPLQYRKKNLGTRK